MLAVMADVYAYRQANSVNMTIGVMFIGLRTLGLALKKAVGTVAGFTGLFGYLERFVAASTIISWAVQNYDWNSRCYIMLVGGVLACVLLLLTMLEEGQYKAPLAKEHEVLQSTSS